MSIKNEFVKGKVIDLIHCPGHTGPLAKIQYDNGETKHIIAPEGICVNQDVTVGSSEVSKGSCLALKDIPEGTLIYNIEN